MIKANFSSYNNYVTDSLYQWDINQSLNITGLNLTVSPEIHFANANMERAIVRQSILTDGVVTVNIPNSLLQEPVPIKVYVGMYEGETFKVIEALKIPVIAKEKPTDYKFIDDADEIYSYNEILNKMIAFENKYGEVDFNALEEYNALVDTVNTTAERVDNTYTKAEVNSLNRSNAIIASYLAFVGNTNEEVVNAALGKNNEYNLKGLGRALALYAGYHDITVTSDTLPNLVSCDTLMQMANNHDCKNELVNQSILRNFLFSNEYALSQFNASTIFTFEGGEVNSTVTTTFYISRSMLNSDKFFLVHTVPFSDNAKDYNAITINNVVITTKIWEEQVIYIKLEDLGITQPGNYELGITLGGIQNSQTITIYTI